MSDLVLVPLPLGLRRVLRLLACSLFVAHLAPALAAETVNVLLDQAKLLKLPAGAETIVIGNPAIADVAVQKNGIMVLTGRAPGQTNLIALDPSGTIISETILAVANSNVGKVLVQRGLESNSYECGLNRCLPGIVLGDSGGFFGAAAGQASQRDSMASSGAPGAKK